MKKITIAIDGPAGSGKSTTARHVAHELGYVYIDTGAMYRAVTLAWIREKSGLTEFNLCRLMDGIIITLKQTESGQKTYLNDEDVSDEIRTPIVTQYVSPVSAIACVREKMVSQQRELGKDGGVVMDGRDIGTVVFPNAELKIYLIASIEARAKRRRLEMSLKGIDIPLDELISQITERDYYDSSRSISPLMMAKDAIEIDTSELTIEGQTQKVIEHAKSIIG